jgi:hypothetical protein
MKRNQRSMFLYLGEMTNLIRGKVDDELQLNYYNRRRDHCYIKTKPSLIIFVLYSFFCYRSLPSLFIGFRNNISTDKRKEISLFGSENHQTEKNANKGNSIEEKLVIILYFG